MYFTIWWSAPWYYCHESTLRRFYSLHFDLPEHSPLAWEEPSTLKDSSRVAKKACTTLDRDGLDNTATNELQQMIYLSIQILDCYFLSTLYRESISIAVMFDELRPLKIVEGIQSTGFSATCDESHSYVAD